MKESLDQILTQKIKWKKIFQYIWYHIYVNKGNVTKKIYQIIQYDLNDKSPFRIYIETLHDQWYDRVGMLSKNIQ